MTKQLCLAILATGLLLASAQRAIAQEEEVHWVGTTGSFTDGANWLNPVTGLSFPPDAEFGEDGYINNEGVAQVSDVVTPGPRDLILGREAGDTGTLEVMGTGSFSLDRDLHVGNDTDGGEGHLIVHPGGTLIVGDDLRNRGADASSVRLGGTGAGMTTVDVSDQAELLRNTHVIGPNVDFTAASLILGGGHTLTAEITGPSHSPLQASGSATLGGTLHLEFNGVTPSLGDSWQVVDAGSISGNFSSVTSNVPLSDPGFGYFVETVPGGNGRVTQVSVDARLLLSVDRENGAVTLSNPTTSESFEIDGYLIASSGAALNPSGWNSFQEGGMADWRESNPGPNHLGELNLASSRVVNPEESINLGNIFSPAQFGAPDDLTFEYHVAGGMTRTGLIQYSGPINNLVLTVDPETGEAALQNQSTFDVDIDGYLITSASGALNPEGWISFSDGGMGDWRESNPAANHIGELSLGSSLLQGRGTPIFLGNLFDIDNPAAEQDLTFEFHVAGGETMIGVVEYGELPDVMPPETIPGDYNNNGRVEQADLDLVLLNWNQGVGGLPAEWINERPTSGIIDQAELDQVLLNWNRTMPALGTAAAVPEPATWMMAGLAMALMLLGRSCRTVTGRTGR